ncbi:MAG: hypothetical protein JO246_13240 [Frankiaceae bacterium]|nr:hypothetical protein [Frankiaceae bacterium]MBV9871087.1 hypothetical protein [Frankiaceae bacterium]
MIIDCDSCEVRNIACDDCVVSVLLAAPPAIDSGDIEWSEDESGALRALAAGGLVPPLRMKGHGLHQTGSATG